MALRVVLADDHVVLRQGVRALLERHGFSVVAEASDGRAGVRGFVLKTQAGEDLALAIEQVSRGGFYVGAGVSQAVVDACRAAAAADRGRLTSRERQVVQLVAEGKSTKQVAALLAITPKTAEFHRTRVMKKLNVHDVAGLVRYAIREGLITP